MGILSLVEPTSLHAVLECSEEDQGELPIQKQCMMPISVREHTRKEQGKEKMICHEEKRPPSSVVKLQYWQDREPLCQNICVSTFSIA